MIQTLESLCNRIENDGVAALSPSAAAGIDFKQTLPLIKDTDLDMDRRMRTFENVVDCLFTQARRKPLPPYYRLQLLGHIFAAGSVRKEIWDTSLPAAPRRSRCGV